MSVMQRIIYLGFATAAIASASLPALSWTAAAYAVGARSQYAEAPMTLEDSDGNPMDPNRR